MQDAATGSDLEDRALVQPGTLEAPAGTGAVTRAQRARYRIPEVVKPAMRMRGVHLLLLGVDPHHGLVDEDVRVDQRVGDVS